METTKNTIKLKGGGEIPRGCAVTWNDGKATVHANGKTYRVSALGAAKALGVDIPGLEALEEWTYDGICESVLGETVEPDGIDEHGSPSWLLAMGMI